MELYLVPERFICEVGKGISLLICNCHYSLGVGNVLANTLLLIPTCGE